MTLRKFRARITYILLFSKFAVIGAVFLHFLQHKFDFAQTKELLFIIMPLFTVYLTVIIKFLAPLSMEPVAKTREISMTGPFISISLSLPIIFAVYMIIVLTFQSAGTAEDNVPFQQTKEMIGWGESIFGIYIGYIVQAIFKKTTAEIA